MNPFYSDQLAPRSFHSSSQRRTVRSLSTVIVVLSDRQVRELINRSRIPSCRVRSCLGLSWPSLLDTLCIVFHGTRLFSLGSGHGTDDRWPSLLNERSGSELIKRWFVSTMLLANLCVWLRLGDLGVGVTGAEEVSDFLGNTYVPFCILSTFRSFNQNNCGTMNCTCSCNTIK